MRLNTLRTAAAAAILQCSLAASARADFIETYDTGTDTGQWICSNSQPRTFVSTGGNPNQYLQQGGFSSSIPNWSSASPRYQPGVNDTYKINSIFVGDWVSAGVTDLVADLNVLHAGSWPNTEGRPVTMQIMQMDSSGFSVNYVAYYSTPVMFTPPVGWNHYDFTVDAGASGPPSGWVFTRGDGSTPGPGEWTTFLSRIDIVTLMYAAPGFAYPSLGTWTLGIDNVGVLGVPGPASAAFFGLGSLALIRRRCRAGR